MNRISTSDVSLYTENKGIYKFIAMLDTMESSERTVNLVTKEIILI